MPSATLSEGGAFSHPAYIVMSESTAARTYGRVHPLSEYQPLNE